MKFIIVILFAGMLSNYSRAENASEEEEANTFIMDILDDPSEADLSKEPAKAKEKFVGYKIVKSACAFHEKALEDSPESGKIKKGLKIWVESEGGSWYKVYRKTGVAFVAAECFEPAE